MNTDNKTDEKTYVVYCHTTPDGSKYYGVTCNIKWRWRPSSYKNCTRFNDAIIEYGWSNITHEVVASFQSREEALKLEDELIKMGLSSGNCLNKFRSGHFTQTEEYREDRKVKNKTYYENNKDEIKHNAIVYYENHKVESRVRTKAYREANKEDISVKKKAYYEDNRDDILAKKKAYYEAKKDEINERRRERYKRKKK